MTEPHTLSLMTAAELVAGFRTGEHTPVDAARAALAAIEQHDGPVHAFCLVDPDTALRMAEESTARWAAGEPLGPADGVPVSIKDMFLTAGWPTRRGSGLYPAEGDFDEDAPAVARLREAGTVFLGKTTTPELAWKGVTDSTLEGVTGNPWDARMTSGGSSGGSATAVGLGMGTWSIGTDGGGSVRIPASFTGTVALKPTYGLVPMYPSSAYGTLAHAGPMTRTVTDCALLLDLICGADWRDWSALPTPTTSFLDGLDAGVQGVRIALSTDLGFGHNDPEVDASVRAAADVLRGLGAVVDEVDPEITDPTDAFHVLWFTGARKTLDPFPDELVATVDGELLAAIETYGLTPTASDYLDAVAERMAMGRRFGALHEEYDVLLTPTMPIPAFPAGQSAPDGWPSSLWTSWTPYTYPFNMTQQPALSLPCGFTRAGLPIGLQVVGPRHADAVVLRVGRAYEAATSWHRRLPPPLAGAGAGHPTT